MFGGKIGLPELIIILVVIVLIIKSARSRSFAGVLLGLCLGAFVGFLLRPSVAMIGQLPFETVVTRGANLRGMDVVLRAAAEQSFNYMVVGAIVGAVILGIWGSLASKPKSQPANVQLAAAASGQSTSTTPAAIETTFCTKCGKALTVDMAFCSGCGTRKS
jgi:membrane protease subunit (stomatin/prohibitin family)